MKHTKINLILTAIAFTVILYASAIKSLTQPGHSHPLLEKRRLNSKPETPSNLKSLASFPQAFEDFYKDNFEFRYSWLNVYKYGKFKINDPANDKVIFGKESGWLFFNDRTANDVVGDFRNINQFTDKTLNRFVNNLKAKQQWLAKQGIEYIFVIAPSKHYVYPELLPGKYKPTSQQNIKTQLTNAIKQHPEINYLDLTDTVIAGKSEQQMFLKNDTHWTDFATNLAQLALSKKLATIFPGKIEAIKKPWSDFKNKQAHTGDLEQINGLLGQFTDYRYLPEFNACAEDLQPPKTQVTATFDTDCGQTLRALVFRDSFFSNLQPFVSERLGLSRFIWQHMTFDTAENHIEKINPDIVIEEWVDRHLPNLHPPQ